MSKVTIKAGVLGTWSVMVGGKVITVGLTREAAEKFIK